MNNKGLKASAIWKILKDPKKMRKFTQAAFDEVDLDNSGSIEMDELTIVLMNVSQDIGIEIPTDDEITAIWKELDDNDDGQIAVDEFQIMIRQILEVLYLSLAGFIKQKRFWGHGQ